jgi:hypothetical protein
VAREVLRNAQIMVIALEQTIASLRERGEAEWAEEIQKLTELRDATVERARKIDPTVRFEVPDAGEEHREEKGQLEGHGA